MNIKRIIAVLSVIILIATSFAACKDEEDKEAMATVKNTITASESQTQNTTEKQTNNTTAQSTTEAETQVQTTQRQIVSVTIPEGYSFMQIANKLEEKGVCSAKDFYETAQSYSVKSFSVPSSSDRCFKFEGYLFPDTYEFYKNEDPNLVLDKLISAMEASITSQMRSRASALGYSMHEMLTIASIIEKEAQSEDERGYISSVLHNRLDIGMQLQCDVTINYVEYVIYEVYPDNDTYKYYYNTYRCAALPAGPICNPGMASIQAALYPEDTDYLYFAVVDGKALYAADYNTHLANCEKLGIEL